MPTLKTVKGVKERFKVTATGRVLARKAGRRHLLSSKRAKVKRRMRRGQLLSRVDERKIRALLPYA